MPNDAHTMSVMVMPNSAPQCPTTDTCLMHQRTHVHQCVCGTHVHAADSCIGCSAFHCAMQTSLHITERYLFCPRTIPGMYCNKHHLQKLSRLKAYEQWLASCFSIMLLVSRSRCHTISDHKQKCPVISPRYPPQRCCRVCQNISGTKPHMPINKANHAASIPIAVISDSASCTSQRYMVWWLFEAMLSTYESSDVQYCRTALPDASLSIQAREISFSQAKRASLTCSGLRFSCLTAKWYAAGLGFQALGCVISIILSSYCSTCAFSRRPFVMDMLPLVMVEI